MSVDVYVRMVVGVELSNDALMQPTGKTIRQCPNDTKHKLANGKHCPECGETVESFAEEVPTDALRAFCAAIKMDISSEDFFAILEDYGEHGAIPKRKDGLGYYCVDPVQSSGDDDCRRYAMGYCVEFNAESGTSWHDKKFVPQFDLNEIEARAKDLMLLLRGFNLPDGARPKIYLSAYWSV